ncbi:AAA family ATPase [Thermus tengchongensis]|uniref:AAA family ATPase n=1 Tax=Thermus tengchongensis TaxID=1214928 RepID=UPI000B23C0EA|nr:AAA family ATPase [Thermus tengchongensis]
MERFGLKDRLHAPLASLSRGMQQKAALALALALKPRFLLLDEPTLGLDPVSRREFEGILLELKKEGWGILLTSHDLEVVERVSDRVAFLHRGEVRRQGPPGPSSGTGPGRGTGCASPSPRRRPSSRP